MNSKGIYVALSVLVVSGLGAGLCLLNRGTGTIEEAEVEEPPPFAASERRAEHVERLQQKLRTLATKSKPVAAPKIGTPPDVNDSRLVMVDVADIDDSAWVQSMYDTGFRYEGPVVTQADREARELKQAGVHSEASIREKEDALAAALPEMKEEIERARKEREADRN